MGRGEGSQSQVGFHGPWGDCPWTRPLQVSRVPLGPREGAMGSGLSALFCYGPHPLAQAAHFPRDK